MRTTPIAVRKEVSLARAKDRDNEAERETFGKQSNLLCWIQKVCFCRLETRVRKPCWTSNGLIAWHGILHP